MKKEPIVVLVIILLGVVYASYRAYMQGKAEPVTTPDEVPAVNAPEDANHDCEGHMH